MLSGPKPVSQPFLTSSFIQTTSFIFMLAIMKVHLKIIYRIKSHQHSAIISVHSYILPMVGDDGLFEVDVTAREDTTLTAMSGIASKVPVWKYQNIEISKSQQLIVRALFSATKSSINKQTPWIWKGTRSSGQNLHFEFWHVIKIYNFNITQQFGTLHFLEDPWVPPSGIFFLATSLLIFYVPVIN